MLTPIFHQIVDGPASLSQSHRPALLTKNIWNHISSLRLCHHSRSCRSSYDVTISRHTTTHSSLLAFKSHTGVSIPSPQHCSEHLPTFPGHVDWTDLSFSPAVLRQHSRCWPGTCSVAVSSREDEIEDVHIDLGQCLAEEMLDHRVKRV